MLAQQAPLAIIHLVGFVLFLAVGLLGAFWPRAVQTYELKALSAINPFLMESFLHEYVRSEIYIWQVRAMGVFCLLAAGVLCYPLLGVPPDVGLRFASLS